MLRYQVIPFGSEQDSVGLCILGYLLECFLLCFSSEEHQQHVDCEAAGQVSASINNRYAHVYFLTFLKFSLRGGRCRLLAVGLLVVVMLAEMSFDDFGIHGFRVSLPLQPNEKLPGTQIEV